MAFSTKVEPVSSASVTLKADCGTMRWLARIVWISLILPGLLLARTICGDERKVIEISKDKVQGKNLKNSKHQEDTNFYSWLFLRVLRVFVVMF
jgi:hypothetical protein